MKNILNKIYVSKLLYILIFLSLISGLFREIIIFLIIIVIHEMGHIFVSLIFDWKIKKVSFNIYGGYITYDEIIDKPFNEEFLISISGFLFQMLFYLFSYLFFKYNLLDYKIFFLIKKYSVSIILFNLLPIAPLDGSKIISVILNMIFSYRLSLSVLNFLSLFSLVMLLVIVIIYHIPLEISYIIIFSFLVTNIINNFYDKKYLFNKFLFERYVFKKHFKKNNYIKNKNIYKIKRRKNNYFYINRKYYSEQKLLKEKFGNII